MPFLLLTIYTHHPRDLRTLPHPVSPLHLRLFRPRYRIPIFYPQSFLVYCSNHFLFISIIFFSENGYVKSVHKCVKYRYTPQIQVALKNAMQSASRRIAFSVDPSFFLSYCSICLPRKPAADMISLYSTSPIFPL